MQIKFCFSNHIFQNRVSEARVIMAVQVLMHEGLGSMGSMQREFTRGELMEYGNMFYFGREYVD